MLSGVYRLGKKIDPYGVRFGQLPINEVTAPQLLAALRQVERKGSIETAHRLRTLRHVAQQLHEVVLEQLHLQVTLPPGRDPQLPGAALEDHRVGDLGVAIDGEYLALRPAGSVVF